MSRVAFSVPETIPPSTLITSRLFSEDLKEIKPVDRRMASKSDRIEIFIVFTYWQSYIQPLLIRDLLSKFQVTLEYSKIHRPAIGRNFIIFADLRPSSVVKIDLCLIGGFTLKPEPNAGCHPLRFGFGYFQFEFRVFLIFGNDALPVI